MAALSDMGVGPVAAGLAGANVSMRIPDYEAKRYEATLKDGNI